MSEKLISAPKHCYLNICTPSYPSTSQSLTSGQTATQRLKKSKRKQFSWIFKKPLTIFLSEFLLPVVTVGTSGSLSFVWKFVYARFASRCLFLCKSTAKGGSFNRDQRMPYQMSREPPVRAAKLRSVKTEEWKLHTLGMSVGGSKSIPELKRTPVYHKPGVLPSDSCSHSASIYFF